MRRRTFFIGAASLIGAGGVAWANRNNLFRRMVTAQTNEGMQASAAVPVDADMCVLTPDQAEGPYFVRAPLRSDVREDRTGIEFDLTLKVVQVGTCDPLAQAVVELWHCDNAGRYSSYPENLSRSPLETLRLIGSRDLNAHVEPTNNKTYLRGAQVSDENGIVRFKTIFPGWYDPRIPHIHVKVFLRDESQLTTQFYFDEALTQEIYASHPDYAPYGSCPYSLSSDMVIRRYLDASGLVLNPQRDGNRMEIAVQLGVA